MSILRAYLASMKSTQERIASAFREELRQLRLRIACGDESSLFIWALPEQLACSQRPLRDHPDFGGRGRPFPPEARPALLAWVERVKDAGIRSIITLMHSKEIKYYEPIGAHPEGLLGLYRSAGFQVDHIPWADPAHETTPEACAAVMRHLEQVKQDSLAAFQRLSKPVLLHCSAAIDRSPPVLAHIVANTTGGANAANPAVNRTRRLP